MTYRSPQWAFWRRFEIPHYDDPSKLYLRRLRIVQTPWFGIMLHDIETADPRPTFHDHPWPFVSVVLRGGGYIEQKVRPGDEKIVRHHVRRFSIMPSGVAHFIDRLADGPTRTLVLHGRRRAAWGYWESVSIGRWRWTRYDTHRHADEYDTAMRLRSQISEEGEIDLRVVAEHDTLYRQVTGKDR